MLYIIYSLLSINNNRFFFNIKLLTKLYIHLFNELSLIKSFFNKSFLFFNSVSLNSYILYSSVPI